jgi:hypothetical protein
MVCLRGIPIDEILGYSHNSKTAAESRPVRRQPSAPTALELERKFDNNSSASKKREFDRQFIQLEKHRLEFAGSNSEFECMKPSGSEYGQRFERNVPLWATVMLGVTGLSALRRDGLETQAAQARR